VSFLETNVILRCYATSWSLKGPTAGTHFPITTVHSVRQLPRSESWSLTTRAAAFHQQFSHECNGLITTTRFGLPYLHFTLGQTTSLPHRIYSLILRSAPVLTVVVITELLLVILPPSTNH
jgi:hypothetical protein